MGWKIPIRSCDSDANFGVVYCSVVEISACVLPVSNTFLLCKRMVPAMVKHLLSAFTLIMADFYSGELVPRLWYYACSLTGMALLGHLIKRLS